MKTIITIILILVSVTCFSQTPTDKPEQKIVMPPDSIAIISLKDIDSYLIALRKISVEDYEKMTPLQVVQDMYRWMIIEWNRKKKK